MVICLEQDADLHMVGHMWAIVQLMPLPITVSCFSKIQIGFTFLVPAHPGSPGQRAVKRMCMCVCVCVFLPRSGVTCSSSAASGRPAAMCRMQWTVRPAVSLQSKASRPPRRAETGAAASSAPAWHAGPSTAPASLQTCSRHTILTYNATH